MARDHQWSNQRRQTKDEQHVSNVAADHVADGQVALAIQRGLHADGSLWRAGAEGHHGEADNQRRNAKLGGQLAGAAHQYFCAGHQQHQAGDQVDDGH